MAVAVMKHSDQKQNRQGEGFNWCLFICLFLNYGLRNVTEVGTETPGRSVQAHLLTLLHVVITSNTGTHGQWGETETLEEYCLMTLWQDCYSAQDRFSRKWWYSQLSGSSYIHQSTIKAGFHRHTYGLIWSRQFLPDDSRLCQADSQS